MIIFDFLPPSRSLTPGGGARVQKYALTFMKFNMLLFLANNPAYTTAAQIVERRRLTKSHAFLSVRSLTE